MFFPRLLAGAATWSLFLFTTVLARGRAIVTNECPEPIYLWSVGDKISPQYTVAPSTSYSETFTHDPVSGGIAIKISPVDGGIFKPNVSQTIFAYNLDGEKVWYDMSDIFGDGFAGRTMTLKPSEPTCPESVWGAGKQPAGSTVRLCGADGNLELTFCTGKCLPSWCESDMLSLLLRLCTESGLLMCVFRSLWKQCAGRSEGLLHALHWKSSLCCGSLMSVIQMVVGILFGGAR